MSNKKYTSQIYFSMFDLWLARDAKDRHKQAIFSGVNVVIDNTHTGWQVTIFWDDGPEYLAPCQTAKEAFQQAMYATLEWITT